MVKLKVQGDRKKVFKALVKSAKNKFKKKPKVLYTNPGGVAINEENVFEVLANGITILVVMSDNEKFSGQLVSDKIRKQQKRLRKMQDVTIEENPQKPADEGEEDIEGIISVEGVEGEDVSTWNPVVRLVLSSTFCDNDAIKQLVSTSQLPGVVLAVGQPDLHVGKGYAIGCSFASEKYIYPPMIGTDIGCGMLAVQLNQPVRSGNIMKNYAAKLTKHQGMPKLESFKDYLTKEMDLPGLGKIPPVEPTDMAVQFEKIFGTVGWGNHFCEVGAIEKVYDKEIFDKYKLKKNNLMMIIHSGSRGYGEAILKHHVDKYGYIGLNEELESAKEYLRKHNNACAWARRNRLRIFEKVTSRLGFQDSLTNPNTRFLLDIFHNSLSTEEFDVPFTPTVMDYEKQGDLTIAQQLEKQRKEKHIKLLLEEKAKKAQNGEQEEEVEKKEKDLPSKRQKLWVHRKGAAPTTKGLCVVPGSRGALSYLVMPLKGKPQEHACYSIAHGAGRKWKRSKSLKTMKKRFPRADKLLKTKMGSHVVCTDASLLYEEVPEAYKDISSVINDLVDFGLVKIVASIKPLLTYKTNSSREL